MIYFALGPSFQHMKTQETWVWACYCCSLIIEFTHFLFVFSFLLLSGFGLKKWWFGFKCTLPQHLSCLRWQLLHVCIFPVFFPKALWHFNINDGVFGQRLVTLQMGGVFQGKFGPIKFIRQGESKTTPLFNFVRCNLDLSEGLKPVQQNHSIVYYHLSLTMFSLLSDNFTRYCTNTKYNTKNVIYNIFLICGSPPQDRHVRV